MAISLTNGTKIPDSAIISQCYANLSMNMQVTSGLFLSQYDKSIPIVSIRLLANNNEQYIPQTGDTITLRFGSPTGNGVKQPCMGWDASYNLYFEITEAMTSSYGYTSAVVEVTNSDGTKQSSKIYVTIVENPVKNN